MISKKCPYCYRDSYSSYDDPNWKCPYCGKKMGSNMRFINEGTKKESYDQGNTCNIIDFASIKEQLRVIRKTKNKCWLNGQL